MNNGDPGTGLAVSDAKTTVNALAAAAKAAQVTIAQSATARMNAALAASAPTLPIGDMLPTSNLSALAQSFIAPSAQSVLGESKAMQQQLKC